jgi:hypothetical protein
MKPLEEYSLGERVVATTVIVILVILLLALIGYLTGGWEPAEAQAVTGKWDERLLVLDKQALDKAYTDQMAHVFSIWIKDGVTDSSRARVGFSNARKGYNAAMSEIEKREGR